MTNDKTCPACGKPTAGYVPCPHCGADPGIRVTIKFALTICAIVLVFGVVYFAMHLATIEPQPVAIASIDRWMDYSYVWIEGVVSYGPQYSATSISFDVYDGSSAILDESSITVEIYDPAFKDLINENKVPRVGDNVKLFGQLRVYIDGSKEFRVASASDVELIKTQPAETTIQEVEALWGTEQSLRFKRVSLEGTITNVRPLSSAKIYTLEDNSAGYSVDIEMYVHNGLEAYQKKPLNLNVLQRVKVNAGVSEYYGKAQIAISDNDEITVIGDWPPSKVSLDSIDATMRDNFVGISGRIVFVSIVGDEDKSDDDSLEVVGRYLWLDNKYNPRIWLDEGIYKLLEENVQDQLERGVRIELVGKVSRTDIQVVDATKPRIDFIGPQEPGLPGDNGDSYQPPPLVDNFVAINEEDNRDDLVMVAGTITDIENAVQNAQLPNHQVFSLQDNFGGSIKIWVSNTIYERLVDPPEVGDSYQVVGKVTTRGGTLVIQPGVMSDLQKVS